MIVVEVNFVKKTIEQAAAQEEYNDCVNFMAAYRVCNYKRKRLQTNNDAKIQVFLKKFHIQGFLTNSYYITPNSKIKYDSQYDAIKKKTKYNFKDQIPEDEDYLNDMFLLLTLQNATNTLFDNQLVSMQLCFNMESFLVKIASKKYQVDSIAFILNGILIVNFELVDCETGVPLNKNEVFKGICNFGSVPVDSISYFDETDFAKDNRKISDVISDNVFGFLNQTTKGIIDKDSLVFVHNMFVVTDAMSNPAQYIQEVLNVKIPELELSDISTTDVFSYYTIESVAVTVVYVKASYKDVLIDCLVLESLKMIILLEMIYNCKMNYKLKEITGHQVYIESLFFPSQVPAITYNLIDSIKDTKSFKRYEENIEHIINILQISNERKNGTNSRFLNILLFLLTAIGCIQTLPVIEDEFGIPFNISFLVFVCFAVILVLVWAIKDKKFN